jgi:predicted dienelactone hydrolase
LRSRFFSAYSIAIAIGLALAVRPTCSASAAPVGFTNASVAGNTASRGDLDNRLHVVIWYPAAAGTQMEPIEIGPPGVPYFVESQGALDAPFAATPAQLPFIVVSHGTGGTAMDLSWLCAGLAARGYIVASVDHPGNNALEAPTVAGNAVWWLRADDLSRVIDGVLQMPRFGSRVDRGRIGAAGFSLGGYTVLAIAGARGDDRLLSAYCAREPATAVCSGAATPTMPDVAAKAAALAQSDPAFRAAMASNMTSHRDGRVKAVFSIAPALGPAIIPESLAAIDVPVAVVAGMGDPIVPVLDNAVPDALGIPDAELTLFPKAVGHYSFLTDCAPAGQTKFAAICGDAGPARTALHLATTDLAAAFFDRTLHVAR